MSVEPSDLVRWVRRYEATDRRVSEERRQCRVAPAEAFRRALALSGLVRERMGARALPDLSEEDLRVYLRWAGLRRRDAGEHD